MEPNLTFRDYLEALERNRHWLMGPVLAAVTIGTVGALLWPDTYVSEAVLRVSPPAASSAVVPTPLNGVPLAERLAVIQQSILSRSNLTGIIQNLDLYRAERDRMPMEDVIERMRRAITVAGVAQSGAGHARSHVFRVSFAYRNRFDAHRVAQSLVSRFIDESAREKSNLNTSVNHFLREEFEKAQGELDAAAAELARYRRESGGGGGLDAPGLLLQQLTLLETRASAANGNLGRARQEEAVLETEVRLAREAASAKALPPPAPPTLPTRAAVPAAPSAIMLLERELEMLKARYRPAHPEVVRLAQRIEAMKASEPALPPPPPPPPTQHQQAASPAIEPAPAPGAAERLLRAEGQLRAKRIEIARYQAELEEVTRESARIRAGLAGAPERLAEFERLNRQRELAEQRHTQAKNKLMEGQAAEKGNLWRLDESIELVDAPALPETPVAPQRLLVAGVAAVLGILAGAAIVVVRELGDETLKTVRQVRSFSALQVLAGIPLIENELVIRRRRRTAFLGWVLALALSAGSIAGAAVYRLREL